MSNEDFFEIDFLDVGDTTSGDAITIRVVANGIQTVSVVDGGYKDCGDEITAHIQKHYGGVTSIKHVVLTHPDGDHAAGLKVLLEKFTVERLWMNRPWLYADQLINQYPTYTDVGRLKSRLRKAYPNVRDLEEIAEKKGILIEEAFQGASIGYFVVMSPTRAKFLELVARDDDKAEEFTESRSAVLENSWLIQKVLKVAKYIASAWGEEILPRKETTPRNEMSIVQYAELNGIKVLLTGDAGPEALDMTIAYAPFVGLQLPGIDRFQVPHHGSRRNVSSDLFDTLLGPKKVIQDGNTHFSAFISAGKNDDDHPKRSVVRGLIHRGAEVAQTKGKSVRTGWNKPKREGWVTLTPAEYPQDQEE